MSWTHVTTPFFALHALTHALQVSSVDPGDSGKELGTLTTQFGDRRHHVPFVNGSLEYRKEKQSYSWNPSGLWKTSWRVGQELLASDPPIPPPPVFSTLTPQLLLGKKRERRRDRNIGCLPLGRFQSHDNRELVGKGRKEGDRAPC